MTGAILIAAGVVFLALALVDWLRPKPKAAVSLVRHVPDAGKHLPDRIGHGFGLLSEGEATAFDVSIRPFTFGRFTASVDGVLPQLPPDRTEQVIAPIWVERDGHNSTDLEAAWRTWEEAVPAGDLSVACVVQWHDGEHRWQRPYRLRRTVTKERIKVEPAGRATRR
jgi:hypothetical protein